MKTALFYGSYRSDRQGIALARWLRQAFEARGDEVRFVDAKETDLPMLDRMYKEYEAGSAPQAMEKVADTLRWADGFCFVVGEYNWGVQPGLKNLTDHFLEQWFWRPAAIACYSAGPRAGVRAMLHWRAILGEMGMVVTPTVLELANIGGAFSDKGSPAGDDGKRLKRHFPRFADELAWWGEAAKAQRAVKEPPY